MPNNPSQEAGWFVLDPPKMSVERTTHIRGVRIQVFVSPYDVPQAVRGYYDPHAKVFVIEFKYIDVEPVTRESRGQHFTVRIGKNSGRLYGIEIDVHALKAEAVSLQVRELLSRAIEGLEEVGRFPSRTENYRLVRDAIAARKDQLFQTLPAT